LRAYNLHFTFQLASNWSYSLQKWYS